jgi:hypothetical protein
MKQSESKELFELIRDSDKLVDPVAQAHNNAAILWAVRYHAALYFAGLARADRVMYDILLSANTLQDKNLVARLGLDNVARVCDEAAKAENYGNGKLRVERDAPEKDDEVQ